MESKNNDLLRSYNPDGKPWWEIPDDGSLYRHLVTWLHEAGRDHDLYRLLIGSPRWMQAQLRATRSNAAYIGDLTQMINMFRDPLTADDALILAQLWAARQAANVQVQAYTDLDLQTLVNLGRTDQALANALLRPSATKRFWAVKAIFDTLDQTSPIVIDALLAVSKSVHPMTQMVMLLALAVKLTAEGDDRAAGFADQALTLYQAEPQKALNTVQIFMSGFARANRAKEALEMLRAMEHSDSRLYSIAPVALELVRQGYTREALDITAEIDKLLPRSAALGTIALELANQQASEAPTTFDQAFTAAQQITNIQERTYAMLNIVDGMFQAKLPQAGKLLDQVLATAQRLDHPIVRSNAFREIATKLANYDRERALVIFNQAETMIMSIDQHDNLTDAYLKALAQAGFTDLVLEKLQTINADSYRPDAIFPELARHGSVKEALALADTVKNKPLKAKVFREIAYQVAVAKHPDAEAVFQKSLSIVSHSASDYGRDLTVRHLAVMLVRAGYKDTALEIALNHQQDEDIAYTLGDIAAEMKDRAEAETTFDLALTAAKRITTWSKFYAASEIAAHMLNRDFPKGEQVFEELVKSALAIKKSGNRDNELGYILRAQVKAKCIDQAVETASAIQQELRRHEAMRDIAIELGRLGRFEQALSMINALTEQRHVSESLYRTVIEMARHGDIKQAVKWVDRIPYSLHQARALAVIASELSRTDTEGGNTRFEQALELAYAATDREYDPRESDSVLGQIAVEMARIGQFERAQEVVKTMSQSAEVSYVQKQIAPHLAHDLKIVLAFERLGLCEPSKFIQAMIDWSDGFEQLRPGLTLDVLRETMRIIAWISPEWQPLYALMPEQST